MFEALNLSDETELLEQVNQKQYGSPRLQDDGVTWNKLIAEAIEIAKRGQLGDDSFTKGWKPVHGDYDELSEENTVKLVQAPERSFKFRTQAGEEYEASRRPSGIVSKILSTPQNRKMFLAMAELKIPHYDFKAKNLGISQTGEPHMVLLDATLFDASKARREL
jgi:hypothetical protein